MVSNHVSKNTSADHLLKFYDDFSTLKKNRYDCLIITGAPVEHLEFEEVDYWDELCEIMEWSKTHVYSTLHICWGAQAGLYYHYHIQKHLMKQKVFGIYPQTLCDEYNFLTQGKEIQLPFNYFPEDDPQQEPVLTWRSHANLLYRNWLNYVYQMTPYDLQELSAYKQEHNVAAASV